VQSLLLLALDHHGAIHVSIEREGGGGGAADRRCILGKMLLR
jgi:hypothetical protein